MHTKSDTCQMAARLSPFMRPGDWWTADLEFPEYAFCADGRVVSFVKKTARQLRPITAGQGYHALSLRNAHGELKRVYVHHIIARLFHGPRPEGLELRHLDGDPTNNDFENLAYGTRAENAADKARHGTNPAGERNGMARLTWDAVIQMRARRQQTGDPYHAIAADFGVSTMTAYRAITGQSWRNQ